jgi:monofunctional biosynthetic peptidoglycan transglycosylase
VASFAEPDLLSAFAAGALAGSDHASRAELSVDAGVVVFRGAVTRQLQFYGGDAARVRTAAEHHDLSSFDGLTLRVRGDGRRYLLRLTTSASFAGTHYEACFDPGAGQWNEITIPFSAFRAICNWRELPGHPPLEPGDICTFGFAVYYEEGEFQLEVASLEGHSAPAETQAVDRDQKDAWSRWLEAVLFPLALEAAGLPGSTSAGEVFAGAHERRASARTLCYEDSAMVRSEGLLAVRAAQLAPRRTDDRSSSLIGEAIVYLAMEAAYELAIASDLVAAAPDAPPDFLEREARADRAFSRWEALDAPVRAALSDAGLSVESD